MAQQSFDQNSSGQRRRKMALLLALLLACITIGIGGSMYYQQKKAKAAALAAASQDKPADNGSTSTGVVAGVETPSLPSIETPALGSGPEEVTKPEERTAPVAKRTQKVASKKKDDVAEKLLTSTPTAAGPQTDGPAPGSLLDNVAPAIVSAAPQQDAPSLINPLLESNPTGAGGGDAPIANNVTPPPGTGGQTPGGVAPITPVPEPSTWLMMLGGLGLMAAAARRRK